MPTILCPYSSRGNFLSASVLAGLMNADHRQQKDIIVSTESSENHREEARLNQLKELARRMILEIESLKLSGSLLPYQLRQGINLRIEVQKFETELIWLALEIAGGNQQEAAKLLGLKKSTICSKIKRFLIGE